MIIVAPLNPRDENVKAEQQKAVVLKLATRCSYTGRSGVTRGCSLLGVVQVLRQNLREARGIASLFRPTLVKRERFVWQLRSS